MAQFFIALCFILLGLVSCNSDRKQPSEASLKEAVHHVQSLVLSDDPEALANLFVIPPRQSREDNIKYAKLIQNAKNPDECIIHSTRVSGNMGVSMISSSADTTPWPLYARWENHQWRFFRRLVIWGNTNHLDHFGLSETEMKDAIQLQNWVATQLSENQKGSQ